MNCTDCHKIYATWIDRLSAIESDIYDWEVIQSRSDLSVHAKHIVNIKLQRKYAYRQLVNDTLKMLSGYTDQ